MEQYDQIGNRQQWAPYLMAFCQANCDLSSVSTDNFGFRTTLDRAGHRIDSQAIHALGQNLSIIVGSSSVFGVGATHDGFTIPSILNRITYDTWLNFGGRAFNSTQELILFMLHLPRRPQKLLLFSGANNIILSFLNKTSPIYGAYFNQSTLQLAMNGPSCGLVGTGRAIVQLLKKFRLISDTDARHTASVELSEDGYQNILVCFQRDLRAFRVMANGLGSELYFALQPLATWIDKTLSPEESQLFEILDGLQPKSWKVLSRDVGKMRERYFDDMEKICNEEKVLFYNVNLDPAFRKSEWLFVDRVHLTDRGYALAAEIVKREFDL